MKRILMALALVLAGATISMAGTSGGSAPAVGKVNIPMTVPKAAKATCKTLAAGSASTQYFDVSSTTMINWKAVASATDSTARVLKRCLNTNTTGSCWPFVSSESNLPIDSQVSRITFRNYTAASPASSYICVDMN